MNAHFQQKYVHGHKLWNVIVIVQMFKWRVSQDEKQTLNLSYSSLASVDIFFVHENWHAVLALFRKRYPQSSQLLNILA